MKTITIILLIIVSPFLVYFFAKLIAMGFIHGIRDAFKNRKENDKK